MSSHANLMALWIVDMWHVMHDIVVHVLYKHAMPSALDETEDDQQ